MIIQCEKCQTKFRLDDSRVTDKGVKVRCTKCKHVFTVRKEESEADAFAQMIESPDSPSPFSHGDETSANNEDTLFGAVFMPEEHSADNPAGTVSTDFSSLDTSTFDTTAISFESDHLDLSGTENDSDVDGNAGSAAGGEVDFSSFDFGDSDSVHDAPPPSYLSADDFADSAAETTPAVSAKVIPQGLDFSDDDMFGAVVPPTQEVSNDTISFDFEDDSFAASMDMGSHDGGGKSGALFSLDTPGDAPFNLGEIDFGDELTSVAVQQVNPDDLKPSQEVLFAPLAEAQDSSADDKLAQSFLMDQPDGDQELPPLSIVSRRKQSPLFSGLIAVIALLVVSVLGYLGYSSFSSPKETAAVEAGKIGVRDVKATFIKNGEAGELLVISGEAINEFKKPRAALQVKATVFDAAGHGILTKSAYGGNPLTDEQLESLPLSKIEAAMANQFGDSLANMEVAPGTPIPFVVVLANLPKGAKDFAVESVGSTVAAAKQQ